MTSSRIYIGKQYIGREERIVACELYVTILRDDTQALYNYIYVMKRKINGIIMMSVFINASVLNYDTPLTTNVV